MPRLRVTIAALLILALPQLVAAAGPLLEATTPGAYAARFWPDRVVLTYSTAAPVSVTVQLPAASRWAVLDDKPLAPGMLKWEKIASSATVSLPSGDHTVVIGWAGSYVKPAANQQIPVLLDGKRVGVLACDFDLEKLQATGIVTLPVGTVRARLAGLKSPAQPLLTIGTAGAQRWTATADSHEASNTFAVGDATPITLVIPAYKLLKPPLTALELQTVQAASEPIRLEKMPAQGLLIEAEDFSGEGQGKVEASTRHFDLHGGACLMTNSGDGHWLEYRFKLDQPGRYDLFVRAATQEPFDLRSVTVDGRTPTGLGLIRFPGTGGWGYSASEWAALQLTGREDAPSLQLAAGEHVLRLTGEGSTHLNLDYLMLVPR